MPTIGIGDLQGGIGPQLDVLAGLVQAVVMAGAHQDKILKTRWSVLGDVDHVMPLAPP